MFQLQVKVGGDLRPLATVLEESYGISASSTVSSSFNLSGLHELQFLRRSSSAAKLVEFWRSIGGGEQSEAGRRMWRWRRVYIWCSVASYYWFQNKMASLVDRIWSSSQTSFKIN
ncbi:hypothetical protein SASPL_105173 [Salvia splendens]|uniref:Uncharacterized protein n=1 Tax=Salvia splendens TaxID=180675 RepID=A0A8X9ABC6_SALSN|nr:hypothetical protein SASPL_105173 [Salvia splendens]